MVASVDKLLAEASPPQAVEAEAALLGAAMMAEADYAESIVATVPPEAIYSARHQPIFRAVLAAVAAGEKPDAIVVTKRLIASGEIAKAGGGGYVAQLRMETLTGANWAQQAAMVNDAYRLRRILGEAIDVVRKVYSGHQPDEMLDHWAGACRDLLGFGSSRRRATTAAELARRTKSDVRRLVESGEEPAMQLGLPDLDRMIGGLFPGEFSIVAARPSQGKSAFAWQVAAHIAQAEPTLFVSLEMPEASLAHRHFAERSGLSSLFIRTGRISAADLQLLEEPAAHLSSLRLHVKDAPGQTVADIRTELLHLEREHGAVPLIVVDYLQIVTPSNRRATRFEQVSQISSDLRRLARETGAHVMALSQINRAAEKNKLPGIADIRESGNIEQDADMVLLIHNPIPEEFVHVTEAKIIVGKCRNGITGSVAMNFRRSRTRFECIARDSGYPPQGNPSTAGRNGNAYHGASASGTAASEMGDGFEF